MIKNRNRNGSNTRFFSDPDRKVLIAFIADTFIRAANKITAIRFMHGESCLLHQLFKVISFFLHERSKTNDRRLCFLEKWSTPPALGVKQEKALNW